MLEDPEERIDLALTQPALAEDIYQRMLRAQDTWFNPDRGQPDPRACEVAEKTGFWGPFVEEEADAATEPPVALASKPVAKPSPQQLAWQDLEVSSMLGWNLQTICRPRGAGGVTSQRCQASSKTEGPLFVPTVEQIAEWDPYNIDTDEWAKASASFGAKYIIIVADRKIVIPSRFVALSVSLTLRASPSQEHNVFNCTDFNRTGSLDGGEPSVALSQIFG